MDTSRFEALSTEVLLKVQNAVKAILATRLDTALRVGRIGSFEHPIGTHRRIMIHKINIKTVSGTEIEGSHNPGGKWKVGMTTIKIDPVTRKVPLTPPPVTRLTPHVPNYKGEVW